MKIDYESTKERRFHEPRWILQVGRVFQALEQYADTLEKALDKACLILACNVNYTFSPNIIVEMEASNRSAAEIEKDYWKEYFMEEV